LLPTTSLTRHPRWEDREQQRPASQETCRDTEKTSTGGVSGGRLQTYAGASRRQFMQRRSRHPAPTPSTGP